MIKFDQASYAYECDYYERGGEDNRAEIHRNIFDGDGSLRIPIAGYDPAADLADTLDEEGGAVESNLVSDTGGAPPQRWPSEGSNTGGAPPQRWPGEIHGDGTSDGIKNGDKTEDEDDISVDDLNQWQMGTSECEDICFECLAKDEAAVTCSACDLVVCSDCLFDHPDKCKAKSNAPLHYFLDKASSKRTNDAAQIQEETKRLHVLTEEQSIRSANNKRTAIAKRAKFVQQFVKDKREAAIQRKDALNREAQKKRRMRSAFDEEDGHQDPFFDDVSNQQMPPEEPPHEETDDADRPPPIKRRKLTGKQKYQQVADQVKEYKASVSNEWAKHGQASSNQPVKKTVHGSGKAEFRIYEVTGEHRSPKVKAVNETEGLCTNEFLKIHPSHHKMMVHNIVFCKWCGYHASRKAQRLVEVCLKKPKHNNAAQQLRRMMKGKHPDSKQLVWPGGLSTIETHKPISLDCG